MGARLHPQLRVHRNPILEVETMFIVGERINATRKRIGEAVRTKDVELIQNEARRQVEAGANMLDVNGGLEARDAEFLPWLVEVVQDTVDVPLCLDSPNPEALRKALPLCRHQPMINSITEEQERLEEFIPLIREYKTKIIALCLGSSAVPTTAEGKMAVASKLIETLTAAGVSIEDIYVDPGIFPVSSAPEQPMAALETYRLVTREFSGIHCIGGMSNVSYGLPSRRLLNSVFLTMAMSWGLDSAIMDPCDAQLMASIAAAEALLGRDEFCANYIAAFRQGKLEPK